MPLDLETLLVINAANLLLLAATLPFIMGRRLSPAARYARHSLIVQALGWIAIIASSAWRGQWQDWVLSTLSISCTSVGQWLMFRALKGWLGRRPMERLLGLLVLLTPLGYALSFGDYALRVGWSNALIAAQLLILARATLWPASSLGGRWRWVMLGCALTMAGFTLARGVLGAFFTELYPSFRTPHPVNLLAALAANVSFVLGNMAVLVAWREEAEAQLEKQAMTDGLTGTLNRHGWLQRSQAQYSLARRHGHPLALLVLDLDHFKAINDQRGHERGDEALRLFGELLLREQRAGDVVARLGGEEFAVLLVHATEDAARAFDQRLRTQLARSAPSRLGFTLNFSAGLAVLGPEVRHLDDLMGRADSALYQAKHLGRGRLVRAVSPPPPESTLRPGL